MKDIKRLLLVIILLLLWANLKPIVSSVEAFRGATDVNIVSVGNVPVSGSLCR